MIAPVWLKAGLADAVLRRARDRAVVLMYHRVVEAEPYVDGGSAEATRAVARFEAQMRFLAERMTPVPLDAIGQALAQGRPLPARAVAVTFDDGYEDNYRHAFPILRRLGIPATIFLTTARIGTRHVFWWDGVRSVIRETEAPEADLRAVAGGRWLPGQARTVFRLDGPKSREAASAEIVALLRRVREGRVAAIVDALREELRVAPAEIKGPAMLSWEQVAEMHRAGVQFGAHTATHPNLAHLEPAVARREAWDSKHAIEARLRTRVTAFAYPFGQPTDFDPSAEHLVRTLGFETIWTASPGAIRAGMDRGRLPRVSLSAMPLAEAAWKICKHLRGAGTGAAGTGSPDEAARAAGGQG